MDLIPGKLHLTPIPGVHPRKRAGNAAEIHCFTESGNKKTAAPGKPDEPQLHHAECYGRTLRPGVNAETGDFNET